MTGQNHNFSEAEREIFYKILYARRDVRHEFLSKKIPHDILMKLLKAAHHAGSVGFMQPWNFVVIDDKAIKRQVKQIFLQENSRAIKNYTGTKKDLYASLSLEGIEESPVNICVTCDSTRGGTHVLGRNTIQDTDVYSTCCAIQNLWLVARAENIGMGWVSILDNTALKKVLQIPEHIKSIAYLCLGYVKNFEDKPMLETAGWRQRIPVEQLIFRNGWNQSSCSVE